MPFQCVAASVEQAAAHWFSSGSLADAVLASCAVPGLLPPVEIDGEHFLDGGLVHSIPVGRALALGAHGDLRPARRTDRAAAAAAPLRPGTWAWSRSRSPAGTGSWRRWPPCRRPSGCTYCPAARRTRRWSRMRYRSAADVSARIERGYVAAAEYLAGLPDPPRETAAAPACAGPCSTRSGSRVAVALAAAPAGRGRGRRAGLAGDPAAPGAPAGAARRACTCCWTRSCWWRARRSGCGTRSPAARDDDRWQDAHLGLLRWALSHAAVGRRPRCSASR